MDLPKKKLKNTTWGVFKACVGFFFQYMNNCPLDNVQYFLSSHGQTYTDRRKAMHMGPPCSAHRWAQKKTFENYLLNHEASSRIENDCEALESFLSR